VIARRCDARSDGRILVARRPTSRPSVLPLSVMQSRRVVPAGSTGTRPDFNARSTLPTATGDRLAARPRRTQTQWLIQGGIQRTGSATATRPVYGNMARPPTGVLKTPAGTCWHVFNRKLPGRLSGRDTNAVCSSALANFTTVNGVIGTELTILGCGHSAQFSAAATDVYVGYRHMDADITCTGAATAAGNCAGAAGGLAKKAPTEGIDVIVMGARVLF